MKPRSLLKKLTDYGLTVRLGDNFSVRLSPSNLINEKVANYVRLHKEALLTALYEEHQERKLALGHRVHVLQNFIKAAYSGQWCYNNTCLTELDEIVDETLMNYNYDLELAIDCWRPLSKSTPEFEQRQCDCGYVPPFCSCLT